MSQTFNIFDAVGSLRGSGPPNLNWLYLVESIVVIILVIFYFFYMGRVLAITVSLILRALFWKSQNAYFDIGGIHFSILGGRIHFTEFRYISRNQSLRIVEGHITWKYWLWRVRSEEDLASEARLPCRVTLSMDGAEWFLYNRTPSYDAILEQMGLADPMAASGFNSETSTNPPPPKSYSTTLPPEISKEGSPVEGLDQRSNTKAPTDWLREALPIEIKCRVGSIIMGNPSTPTVLIAGFERVDGSYAAVKSRSQFDSYKQVYRLNFIQPKIVYRTNPDYEGSMETHGKQVLNRLRENPDFALAGFLLRPSRFASFASFRSLLRKLPRLTPSKATSKSMPQQQPSSVSDKSWAGLARYQSTTDGRDALHHIEYAKVTTLLTSPELEMTYYCDTAGEVPAIPRVVTAFQGLESFDIGNGDLSPEWGVDLVIKGGIITYGPWADCQRTELQKFFTPATFFDAQETPKLKPGEKRLHTALKVFVEFSEGATLRIPTREPSKDWKYDGIDTGSLSDATVRPYGWLDIVLGPNSTLSYVLPMVASAGGYDSLFELHLDELSVASSVNYATFLTAETCRIHCGLPAPLIWDALRTWTINVTLAKPDIFLLRDHITLFSDIAKDWISGPPGDYEHFVPFIYALNLTLSDYTLRLFVNDHNIINNPSTVVDNTLLVCSGPRLNTAATIPSDHYRMECSDVAFRVTTTNLALSMSLPDWNTHSAFLTERTKTFATTPELNVTGNYRFFSDAHPDHVERLEIAIDCTDVVFKAIGWMIRHMFNLRDNYFGTFTHFVTLEEYRHRHEQDIQGDPLEREYRPGKADVFEVVVALTLRNGLMLLPQDLYDCKQAVAFALPLLQVELRNHDFFMELSLNIEPFRVLECSDAVEFAKRDLASIMELPDSVRIQGLEVTANRLFGPQPHTATYICIWSFYLGAVIGSVPPSFLQALSRAGSSIEHNFSDLDNSLPPDFTVPLDPDATFLTVDFHSIDLAIRGLGTAVQIALENGVTILFDDLASSPFLKHINVDVPSACIRFLAPLFGRAAPWMEVASLDADFSVVLGLSSSGWADRALLQRDFIEAQDALTRRCAFLYGQESACANHIGSLFLPDLANPSPSDASPARRTPSPRLARRPRERSSKSSEGMADDEDDTSESSSDGNLSTSTDDDYGNVYAQLPGRAEASDRFSAYGAILRLCQRAPETAFLDSPTFRRLPLATGDPDTPPSSSQQLKSMEQQLAAFESPTSPYSTDRTSISITSRSAIRIVLTPVVSQVAADVLDCLVVDDGLEHGLDDLYIHYLSSQNSVPPTRFANLEVRLSIPSIQLDSIQDVLRPEHTISIQPRKRPTSVSPDASTGASSTVLCTVCLSIDKIALTFEQTKDSYGGVKEPSSPQQPTLLDRKISGSAGQTRLEVFHPTQSGIAGDPMSSRQAHYLPSSSASPRSRPTALEFVIGECSGTVDLSSARALVALHGGDAQLDFVDEAAELIIGSIWSWRVIADVAAPLASRHSQHNAFIQHLVWTIACESERSAITSFPTFLNRASYLVGSSANLRSDDGWKILHNLRHCLRKAPGEIETTMRDLSEWPSPDILLADIVDILSRWQSWDIDAEDLTRSSLLTSLYGLPGMNSDTLPPGSASLSWELPVAVEWRAGRLVALLSDGKRSENYLIVGPLEAFVSSSGSPPDGLPLRARIRLTFHDVGANVDRDLLLLVRHIINVRNTFERKIQLFRESIAPARSSPALLPGEPLSPLLSSIPTMIVDASLGVQRFSAAALADNLQAKATLADIHLSTSIFIEPFLSRASRPLAHQINTNTSLIVGSVSLAAREATVDHEELLLSTDLEQLSVLINAVGSHAWDGSTKQDPSLTTIIAARTFSINVPRDAIRVHEFIEKFKESNLPTYDTLLTELRQGLDDIQINPFEDPPTSPSLTDLILAKAHLQIQVAIPLISFAVQAIPTLRAGYSIRDFSAHAETSGSPSNGSVFGAIETGIHIGAQTIRFTPVAEAQDQLLLLPIETVFDLPVVRMKAHLNGVPCERILVLATIDSVLIKLTAAVIDHILTIQNHFGRDLDDLFSALSEKRAQQAADLPVNPLATADGVQREPLAWDVRVALRGVRIAVEGPQATQWVEAELLEGHASSSAASASQRLHWQSSVQNLALSLAQRTTQDLVNLDRRYRLAFFRLDLTAGNAAINLPELPAVSAYGDHQTPHLHFRLPRIHAVIQPAAIVALGDLLEYFEGEIELRKTSRHQDVEAIRERVIQLASDDHPSGPSWLASCVISLEAQSIGLAIPLGDDGVLAPPLHHRSKSAQSRPAFLTTIPSLKFATQKGSAGYARMEQFAVQFVSDFDQGRKEDFDGPTHKSLNRVLLPQMQCTLRSPKHGPIRIHSDVSGLEIDLEPSVIAYGFSFVDVIRLSHERFARFVPEATNDNEHPAATSPLLSTPPNGCGTLQATFEFKSGTIRMHSKRSAQDARSGSRARRPQPHRRGHSLNDFSHFKTFGTPFAKPVEDVLPDVFRLPGMSVWSEYLAGAEEQDLSHLHVDVSIHSSNNTLYPSLIPFISAITTQLKDRALQVPSSSISPPVPADISATTSDHPSTPQSVSPVSWGRLKFGLSLKVDQSRLEISCLPAAEVTARLTWESGGFLLTISPEVRGIEFAVTVDGIAAGLRHSFSPEDCLLAEAKGIAGSLLFRGAPDSTEGASGLLSIIVNLPDVSAEMNFRHLQDWLCLKAVWLDRMDLGPVIPSDNSHPLPPPSPIPLQPPVDRSSVTTVALVHLGKFRFACDLGQAIGKSTIVANMLDARVRWVPGESRSLTLGINNLELAGQGRAGGSATIEGVLFSTRLRDEGGNVQVSASDLLHIQISLGKSKASLEYEFHKILLVDADPIKVLVGDDWSRVLASDSAELELAFKVKMGSFNVIATVATIPTFASVSQRVGFLMDEKAAQADATLANAGLPPRPTRTAENAVSEMASKLGSRSSDGSEGRSPVRILNRLDIEIERIRVAIFGDHFNDGEVYRLDAGGIIRAQLVRGVNSENQIHRKLELFLGFFSIRKVNYNKLASSQEAVYSVPEWYELLRTSSERNIFKVPTTEVLMDSVQALGGHRLVHKFAMTFGGQVDMALNYALLRNLGSLATAYQEQMDRVLSSKPKPLASTLPSPIDVSPSTSAASGIPAGVESPTDSAMRTISEDALPKVDSEIIKMKLTPLVQAATGNGRELEYEAIEMNIHQPKLNLLGEATPPLEWLGLQRARFPAWIHTGVTSPLEELLIILSSTYQSQLGRQKHAAVQLPPNQTI